MYACPMQPKTPFLFSMPPLFAWPLAVTTTVALILAVHLMFSEPSTTAESGVGAPEDASPSAGSAEGDPATDPSEDATATRQRIDPTGFVILMGLLVVPVGLIPLMARRKRMKALWWAVAGVGTGLMHVLMGGLPLVHPLMVLLALVFLRPTLPATSLATLDVRSTDAGAGASSLERPVPPANSRPLPRRRHRRRRHRQ